MPHRSTLARRYRSYAAVLTSACVDAPAQSAKPARPFNRPARRRRANRHRLPAARRAHQIRLAQTKTARLREAPPSGLANASSARNQLSTAGGSCDRERERDRIASSTRASAVGDDRSIRGAPGGRSSARPQGIAAVEAVCARNVAQGFDDDAVVGVLLLLLSGVSRDRALRSDIPAFAIHRCS
ncbi:hypothetical protein FKP32DRAFT_1586355 [Trametes sanguinea]|nr:hypothetical protein FKP32DRAFT_1586355 [Trametes sanguinea]